MAFIFVTSTDSINWNAKTETEKKINEILRQGVTFWRSSVSSEDLFKYNTLNNQPT